MKIITISREFGSGGRELGKRLSDTLGFDYYDKEIIAAIAKNKDMAESYVTSTLENHGWQSIPLTFRHSFNSAYAMQSLQTGLLLEQKRVIEQIAAMEKDCVIVGRNADILLREYAPFNIFVCADMKAKLQRCFERAESGENLSVGEMERKIRQMDKSRERTREIITGSRFGERVNYHITVNTTNWSIKEITPAVAAFAQCWFGRTNK